MSKKESVPTPADLASELLGTCKPVPDWLTDQSDEYLDEFDSYAVLCDGCGWWSAPEELFDSFDCDMLCDECLFERENEPDR